MGTTGYGTAYTKHQEWVQQNAVQHIQNNRSGYNKIRYSIYKTTGVGTTGCGTAYTKNQEWVQQDTIQHIQNNRMRYSIYKTSKIKTSEFNKTKIGMKQINYKLQD